ncbi:MAG: tRNA preQ1(34) S-adenosylmethionine ribosyltransferase-isomerase QueA [Phycisphaerales bacterium]
MRTNDLDYDLPDGCIATSAAEPRDAARLLVIDAGSARPAEHHVVADLRTLLDPGDLLVVNTSRVIPARLVGAREDSGGRAEGLWLGPAGGDAAPGAPALWRVMIKARRVKPGVRFGLFDQDDRPAGVTLRLLEPSTEQGEEGGWVCRVEGPRAAEAANPIALLQRVGRVPLPPYIRAARKRQHEPDREERDLDRYQCVFADRERSGSVAAPTAGLHFTDALLADLAARGVQRASVVLHVGTGTFKPVETEFVEQHAMHAEWCELPAATARAIVAARARGRRVISVGTTTARTLESFGPAGELVERGGSGWTRLLITPGRPWQNLDALMTNFHLPRSTLLALVAGTLPGGVPELLRHYREAIAGGYRFYSFGDAMLVLNIRAATQ